MVPVSPLSHISNPLVTSSQLLHYKSSSTPASQSTHYATFLLTHSAGILLRLPITTIATAIILLQRYLLGYTPLATTSDTHPPTLLSATALYLAAKLSSLPTSPRSIVNVYAYLTRSTSSPLLFINPSVSQDSLPPDPMTYYVSEGDLECQRLKLFHAESLFLAGIGFNTHVALPHTLALTYLGVLGVAGKAALAKRVLEHLNGALMGPQWLYLTHQPNVLAVGAIYLAAKQEGVKLVGEVNWWEVFDVGREELGFMVVAMGSVEAWVEGEARKWQEGGRVELGSM
jgi:cyclin L